LGEIRVGELLPFYIACIAESGHILFTAGWIKVAGGFAEGFGYHGIRCTILARLSRVTTRVLMPPTYKRKFRGDRVRLRAVTSACR
jgi:hypothetical protein